MLHESTARPKVRGMARRRRERKARAMHSPLTTTSKAATSQPSTNSLD